MALAWGKSDQVSQKRLNNSVHIGDLNIGSTRATYLINEMVRGINRSRPVVIDGPPGNSCAAVAAIKPADLVVLVVEPTPFGFHDMQQTEQILIEMDKDYLIIANKALSDESVDAFFSTRERQCSLVIPLDDRYLKANLAGEILSRSFNKIYTGLKQVIGQEIASS